MKYAYYPGCSAKTSSAEYEESVREMSGYLGIELEEIPGWTCCGASSCHYVNRELAVALPARNLALAAEMSMDMLAHCPACSLRHKNARYELGKDPTLKTRIEEDIGMSLERPRNMKHILEVLFQDVGTDAIKEKVQKPLAGLKVVMYYGCYLVRPPDITALDDPENPTVMEKIMGTLGAEVIDWTYKVDCCGGSLSIASPEIVTKLSTKIVNGATEAGADAIVTACGMCQLNLELRQPKGDGSQPVPVFYFSELMALAFGSDRVRKYLDKHVIDAAPLLEGLELL